jgi:hypothetical protein
MEIHTTRRRGEAFTSIAALALDPRAVVGALGGRIGVETQHSGAHSLHDAIVLVEAPPTTGRARAA